MGSFLSQIEYVKSAPESVERFKGEKHARANAAASAAYVAFCGAAVLAAPDRVLRWLGTRRSARPPPALSRAVGALMVSMAPLYARVAADGPDAAPRLVRGCIAERRSAFGVAVLFVVAGAPPSLLALALIETLAAAHASLSAPPPTAVHSVSAELRRRHSGAPDRVTTRARRAAAAPALPLSLRLQTLWCEAAALFAMAAPATLGRFIGLRAGRPGRASDGSGTNVERAVMLGIRSWGVLLAVAAWMQGHATADAVADEYEEQIAAEEARAVAAWRAAGGEWRARSSSQEAGSDDNDGRRSSADSTGQAAAASTASSRPASVRAIWPQVRRGEAAALVGRLLYATLVSWVAEGRPTLVAGRRDPPNRRLHLLALGSWASLTVWGFEYLQRRARAVSAAAEAVRRAEAEATRAGDAIMRTTSRILRPAWRRSESSQGTSWFGS